MSGSRRLILDGATGTCPHTVAWGQPVCVLLGPCAVHVPAPPRLPGCAPTADVCRGRQPGSRDLQLHTARAPEHAGGRGWVGGRVHGRRGAGLHVPRPRACKTERACRQGCRRGSPLPAPAAGQLDAGGLSGGHCMPPCTGGQGRAALHGAQGLLSSGPPFPTLTACQPRPPARPPAGVPARRPGQPDDAGPGLPKGGGWAGPGVGRLARRLHAG